MIRKILITTLVVFLMSINCYSDCFYFDLTDFINYPESNWLNIRILTHDQYAILVGTKNKWEIASELRIERECDDINLGCLEHFIKDKTSFIENGKKKERYYIPGKGIVMNIILSPSDIVPIWIPYEMRVNKNDPASFSYNKWKKFKEVEQFNATEMELQMNCVQIYDSGIKNIYASSTLSENTKKGVIVYRAENILEKVFYRPYQDYSFIQYDSITPPWVEGKEDYGIGEYLDIEFKWPSDEMQILNGFVDFTRMELYEKNSRVKTVLIESENPKFAKEYQLEDLAKYTLISLPQKTDKIRMTIKDVYPGTKYKDTCLSSILVTNPNVPSYEEMTATILKALKEGYNKAGPGEAEQLKKMIEAISIKRSTE